MANTPAGKPRRSSKVAGSKKATPDTGVTGNVKSEVGGAANKEAAGGIGVSGASERWGSYKSRNPGAPTGSSESSNKRPEADDGFTLREWTLQGTNLRDSSSLGKSLTKIPFLGDYLKHDGVQKAAGFTARHVPVAQPFTIGQFDSLYDSLKADLQGYGQLRDIEGLYRTEHGILQNPGDESGYLRDDRLNPGSYRRFAAADGTLQGILYVGPATDEKTAGSGESPAEEKPKGEQEPNFEARLQAGARELAEKAKTRLSRLGIGGAADAGAAIIFGGPLAVVGAADLGRRLYNTRDDAMWTLQLNPAPDAKVTQQQFEAYRDFVEKYKTKD